MLADDIEIDFEKMSLWTRQQVEAFFESGGLQLPQAIADFPEPKIEHTPPPPPRRAKLPIRFLCLHGGGGNKVVAATQVRRLKTLFGNDATFDYLEGPRIWPDDEVDKNLKVCRTLPVRSYGRRAYDSCPLATGILWGRPLLRLVRRRPQRHDQQIVCREAARPDQRVHIQGASHNQQPCPKEVAERSTLRSAALLRKSRRRSTT